MPPKAAAAAAAGGHKSSAKKTKPVFDPFERVSQFTFVPLRDAAAPPGAQGSSRQSATSSGLSTGKTRSSVAAGGVGGLNGGDMGEDGIVGEFAASSLTITPPLARTEVSLILQFRVSVSLHEGDVIYVYLPKFRGPPAQQFALERVTAATAAATKRGGSDSDGSGGGGASRAENLMAALADGNASTPAGMGDDIDTCTHFRAYWSGESAKVITPVHQIAFKRGKKDGAPPKQVLLLQCIRSVNADTHLIFCVPRALGLLSPDKVPANSAKMKIEGPMVREAGAHRILKQVILSTTEIRKRPVVEELAVYDQCIAQLAQDAKLKLEDRHLGEQLSLEEVEQLWKAAQYRRGYPLPLPWAISEVLLIPYDDAGGFVKRLIQNAIKVIKDFDPLAVHREVARNWGVKPAAVVALDDFLSTQWGGLYPGLPRTSLFAACLLTMEPDDVGRMFPSLLALPERTIAEDLGSAFRMRGTLFSAPAPSTPGDYSAVEAAALEAGVLQDRCGATLDKWAALLTALLPAAYVAEARGGEEAGGAEQGRSGTARSKASVAASTRLSNRSTPPPGEGAGSAVADVQAPAADGTHRVGFQLPPRQEAEATTVDEGTTFTRDCRRRNSWDDEAARSLGAIASMHPPPTLYTGYRDVPYDVQRSMRDLVPGDWFVLPFFVIARQSLPYTVSNAAGGEHTAPAPSGSGSRNSSPYPATGLAEGEEENEPASDGAVVAIPDNAVVIELHNVTEALELADLSLSPYNRAWLLPLVTSCRLLSVEEHQNDVLHIHLEVHGSLVGQVNDPYLPQSDRSVATTILDRYLLKTDQTGSYASALSFFSFLCARRNERRRLHPPTLIRAQYLSHCNAALRAAIAKRNVEESESVEWQVCTHEAQQLEEGVVKPAVWEPIPRKYMLTVEHFFLGHSRTLTKLEEGTLLVDLEAHTIDYGGKGPRSLRRVVQKIYITHERHMTETLPILHDRTEQYAKQLAMLDAKLGITSTASGGATATNTANPSGTTGKKSSTKTGQ